MKFRNAVCLLLQLMISDAWGFSCTADWNGTEMLKTMEGFGQRPFDMTH